MKKPLLTTLVILGIALIAMSQETKEAFKPHGKPIIRVFSNAHTSFADGESKTAFELTRAYLGYEHFFSENFSGTVVYDVGNPGAGKIQFTAFVKNAFLNYKKSNLSIDFGVIPTTQFKVQENFWGYRYLEESYQDLYDFHASADLGTSATYKFNDLLSADVALYNGEGYKKLQSDEYLKAAFGATITPVKELVIRGMADFMGDEISQNTYAGFLGYKARRFSLGAEYNYQTNHSMIEGHDYFGPSIYGTYVASKKVKVFARYDDLQSKTPSGETENWNIEDDGKLFMVGVEFSPVNGIKLTPRYRGWSPAQSSQPLVSTLMLNCEIKF
jgi:hypothetical protein